MTTWLNVLRCVECGEVLKTEFACSKCGAVYERASTGAPILLTSADRAHFQEQLNQTGGQHMQEEYHQRTVKHWTKKFYPPQPVYVNPAAPPLPQAGNGLNLWIGGAGLQLPGFINLDIAPVPGVDIIASAERLPFQESSCDYVSCLALLEHIEHPERAVAEIHRVLKSGGETQVVVPFCHPYHAYPDDYSRFSRDGLANLFRCFRKVDIGIRTGPTTTMLTFATYYLKLLFPVHHENRALRSVNRLVVGAAGWAMAPLKYLDFWMNRLPNAHVLANHFFIVACK